MLPSLGRLLRSYGTVHVRQESTLTSDMSTANGAYLIVIIHTKKDTLYVYYTSREYDKYSYTPYRRGYPLLHHIYLSCIRPPLVPGGKNMTMFSVSVSYVSKDIIYTLCRIKGNREINILERSIAILGAFSERYQLLNLPALQHESYQLLPHLPVL